MAQTEAAAAPAARQAAAQLSLADMPSAWLHMLATGAWSDETNPVLLRTCVTLCRAVTGAARPDCVLKFTLPLADHELESARARLERISGRLGSSDVGVVLQGSLVMSRQEQRQCGLEVAELDQAGEEDGEEDSPCPVPLSWGFVETTLRRLFGPGPHRGGSGRKALNQGNRAPGPGVTCLYLQDLQVCSMVPDVLSTLCPNLVAFQCFDCVLSEQHLLSPAVRPRLAGYALQQLWWESQHLCLARSDVSNDLLELLSTLPKLRHLSLDDWPISAERCLSTSVTHLCLEHTASTGIQSAIGVQFPALVELSMPEAVVNDAGLDVLLGAEALHRVLVRVVGNGNLHVDLLNEHALRTIAGNVHRWGLCDTVTSVTLSPAANWVVEESAYEAAEELFEALASADLFRFEARTPQMAMPYGTWRMAVEGLPPHAETVEIIDYAFDGLVWPRLLPLLPDSVTTLRLTRCGPRTVKHLTEFLASAVQPTKVVVAYTHLADELESHLPTVLKVVEAMRGHACLVDLVWKPRG